MGRVWICLSLLVSLGGGTDTAIAQGTWKQTGHLRESRAQHTATLLPSGKVLVTGGSGASAELYDPGTGTWQSTGALGRARSNHTATLLPSGKVLVTCGRTTSSTPCADLYDPETGLWESTGAPTRRWEHTATLLPSGQVLVAGGVVVNPLSSAELYDPATGTWQDTGGLGTARHLHTATLLPSGKVLVAGGESHGTSLASAELYDPGTGAWEATGSLAMPRRGHTATLLPSGEVLVAGGFDGSELASAELYDPVTGTWASTGFLSVARERHTATLLPSGQLLVAGGYGNTYLSSTELYDPSTGTWESGQPLATPRELHTATLLPSGEVLVAGGTESVVLSSAELYDQSSGTWQSTGLLGTPRSWHSTTLLPSGNVLVAGGYDGSHLSSVELYDPDTGIWTSDGALVPPRSQHTATLLLDGKVLVAGGHDGSNALVIAEIYDPATGTWQATGALATPRSGHTATRLRSGKVLVVAGGFVSDAELYDPVDDTWVSAGFVSSSRSLHTATLLLSGKVLVAGGFDGPSTLSSVDLYDPETGAWESTGSLIEPRGGHSATLLPSGKVLVAGGHDTVDLASAELYDPATGTWQVTGSLAVPRFRHTATLLPSGQVLVAAGASGTDSIGFGPAVASAELYDPSTGTWQGAGSLAAARHRHSATLLLNGQVLVAGGDDDYAGGGYPAGAELYARSSPSDAARAPVVRSTSQPVRFGETFSISGDRFGSDSAGGDGTTRSSDAGFPLVRVRTLDGSQRFWLKPDVLPSFLDDPATLNVSDLPASLNPGSYHLQVISAGVPSTPVAVEVECSLAIITQPSDRVVALGGSPTFSVATQGARAFQWQRDGVDIPGATAPSYTAPPIVAADAGTAYRVRVDSGCVSADSHPDTLFEYSDPATVIVTDVEPPDVEVVSPAGGEYWLLSESGAPGTEVVTWAMSDNIRVCQVAAALLYSDDSGGTWQEAPAGGGLPATFGGAGPCPHPGAQTTSLSYTVPAEPPSGSAGSLYKVRVRATDQAGNVATAESQAPFFIVRSNPDSVRTLILANLPRMEDVQGILPSEGEDLAASLADLAGHPRVQGLVVDLSLVPSLTGLYAAWDADRANAARANAVLFGNGGLHEYLREELLPTYTGVESLVLVGDDRIVPMARLADRTGLVESTYTAGGDLGASSSVGQALAGDYYLSDDLLATRGPVALPLPAGDLEAGAFLPVLSIGRLVETPSEMIRTVAAFISQDGVLDLTALDPAAGHKVLVTGYDFLIDSASKIRRRWNEAFGLSDDAGAAAPVDGRLVSPNWGAGTVAERRQSLRQHLAGNGGAPFAVSSLNGHATHYEEGVPGQHAQDIQGLAASDVYGLDACASPSLGALDLTGGVIYAVGCHGGLSVPGSCAGDADHSLDLPQTFLARGAVAYLANSGYGWGLEGAIGYGERLVEIFTEELTAGGTPRIGELVRRSKTRYFLESPGLDVYDQKSLLQWTLYGLPMYAVRTGITAKAAAPAGRLGAVAVERRLEKIGAVLPPHLTQLNLRFDLSAPEVYRKYDAGGARVDVPGCPHPEGCYYTLNGLVERGTGTADLPVQPYLVYDSRLSGTSQHGALWMGGSYREEGDWQAVVAELASNGGDFSDHGSTPRLARRKIRLHTRRSAGGDDPVCAASDLDLNSLVLVAGEAVAPTENGPYTVQRLYDAIDLEVLYFNDGGAGGNCDRLGPSLLPPPQGAGYHAVQGATVEWAVPASDDAGVWRVVVLYDAGPDASGAGAWRPLELADDGTGVWRGEVDLPGVDRVTYLLQAIDRRGNVSWLDFEPVSLPASGVAPDLPRAIEVVIDGPPAHIFSDGFESGNVSRWSSSIGSP